jgi:KaiC/GvpD/RAD55 family RecA-like ATPase
MDYNLEFSSHILKNKDSLLYILGKKFNYNMLDFNTKGFSPIRAVNYCIIQFYQNYNTAITLEQVEPFVTNICSVQEQVIPILTYFKNVFDYTPTTNFNFLLDTIKKEYGLSVIRDTLLSCTTSLDVQDLEGTVNKIQQGITKVDALKDSEVVEGSLSNSLDEFYDKYKKVQSGEIAVGLKTGFPTFDKNTGGLKPGELDLVIGASNDGKSVCLINIAHNLYKEGKSIIYFSVELPKDQIIRRFLSLAANINIDRFRDGILTVAENERLIKTIDEFKQKKNMFYIVDDPTCTAESVVAKYKDLSLKNKKDLIIIDYLGIMKAKKASDQKWETLGQISLDLRHIARTYNIPVLTAQQVRTEAIRNTKSTIYNMTDLANSALVFHHADTILSIKTKDPVAAMQGLSVIDLAAATVKVRDGNKCQFDITAQFANMRMEEINNLF